MHFHPGVHIVYLTTKKAVPNTNKYRIPLI